MRFPPRGTAPPTVLDSTLWLETEDKALCGPPEPQSYERMLLALSVDDADHVVARGVNDWINRLRPTSG